MTFRICKREYSRQSVLSGLLKYIPFFPLVKNTKRPLVDEWQKTVRDPLAEPEDVPQQYGFALPKDILVIDFDARNFKNEKTGKSIEFKDWVDKFGQFPDHAFIVQTGSAMPSYHVYMRLPELDFKIIKNDKDDWPGIDFLTKNHYVVGPYCIHPETKKVYTPISGDPENLPFVPSLILKELRRIYDKKTRVDNPILETSTGLEKPSQNPIDLERFTEFCKRHEGAVEGERDNTTYLVACKGKDYGLSARDTFDTMMEHFIPKVTSFGDVECKQKVISAYKNSQNKLGVFSQEASIEIFGKAAKIGDIRESIERSDIMKMFRFKPKAQVPVEADFWEIVSLLKPNNVDNVKAFLMWENFGEFVNPFFNLFRTSERTSDICLSGVPPWPTKSHLTKNQYNMNEPGAYTHFCDVLRNAYGYDCTEGVAEKAVRVIADKYMYCPVRDYLDPLKWDGIERCHKLFTHYAGSSSPMEYLEELGRIFMTAMVARTYFPGIKYDYMVILEGPQGIKKSMFWDALGGEFYTEIIIDPTARDCQEAMLHALIVDAGEMAHLSRSAVGEMKMFLTRREDPMRLAYEKRTVKFPRRNVFTGTINPDIDGRYLSDETGNRRFMGVKVEKDLDLASLIRDRDQLFAEAKVLMTNGQKIYFDNPELIEMVKKEQDNRMNRDPWTDIISTWLEDQKEFLQNEITLLPFKRVAFDILGLPPTRLTKRENSRIDHLMTKELGWLKTNVSSNPNLVILGYKKRFRNVGLLEDL